MLKAVIIDDEQDGRDVLNILLKEYCADKVQVVEMCPDGKSGIAAILKHQPDLVFLDIHMPGMDGFEVLDCVKSLPLKVIFVSAHGEFALRAFRYSAVDYLLKPVSGEALLEAVGKISPQPGMHDESGQMGHLLQQLKSKDKLPDTLALPMADGLQIIAVQDILYCKADRNYSHVFLSDGRKFLVSRQLKEFENMLLPHGFFRPHQSYLINMKGISRYIRGDGGIIEMQDGAQIEVSRQRKEEFLKLIQKL